ARPLTEPLHCDGWPRCRGEHDCASGNQHRNPSNRRSAHCTPHANTFGASSFRASNASVRRVGSGKQRPHRSAVIALPLAESQRVDLLGRLSNPPETLETLTGQEVEGSGECHDEPSKPAIGSPITPEPDLQGTPGQLSNPGRTPV